MSTAKSRDIKVYFFSMKKAKNEPILSLVDSWPEVTSTRLEGMGKGLKVHDRGTVQIKGSKADQEALASKLRATEGIRYVAPVYS